MGQRLWLSGRDRGVSANVVPGAGRGVGRGDGCGPERLASRVWVWVSGSCVMGGPNAGRVVRVPVLGCWVCVGGGGVPGRGAAVGVRAWRLAVRVMWGGRLLRLARCRRSQGVSRGPLSIPRGVRRRRHRPGGQARHAVWRAGRPGCCGLGRCRCCRGPCVGACGVVRGFMSVGAGVGALSFLPRRLEGLPQALEDMRVVQGCGELSGVDSLGMEHIGHHGFPCVLRHPSPRWPEPTILRRLPAGPADQAPEGGLRAGPRPQFPPP